MESSPSEKKGFLPKMPAAEILQLPEQELEAVAADAGLPREKLVEMLRKTVREFEERTQIASSGDFNNVGRTEYLRPLGADALEEAEELQAKTASLLDKLYYSGKSLTPERSRALEKQLLPALTRFYALERHRKINELYAQGKSLQDAVALVSKEFTEEAARQANTPLVRQALLENVTKDLPKQFGSHEYAVGSSGPGFGAATGSAEKFSVGTPGIRGRKMGKHIYDDDWSGEHK